MDPVPDHGAQTYVGALAGEGDRDRPTDPGVPAGDVGATSWATSTPAHPGSTCPTVPTHWPPGTSSLHAWVYRRSSRTRARRWRTRRGAVRGCSSSRCRRTKSPRTGCTSTSVRPPACRGRSGWRHWRLSASDWSPWERPGSAATSPLRPWGRATSSCPIPRAMSSASIDGRAVLRRRLRWCRSSLRTVRPTYPATVGPDPPAVRGGGRQPAPRQHLPRLVLLRHPRAALQLPQREPEHDGGTMGPRWPREGSTFQVAPQGARVADGVPPAVVVEVGEHVVPAGVPLPQPVGPPAQVGVGV